jgi:hypothetical protein
VPEQTVTSAYDENESAWLANVTVGDLAQMLADGQTALTLMVDGAKYAVRLTQMMGPSGEQTIIIPDPDAVAADYAVFPMSETTYGISPFDDKEPTEHTVSCRYEAVTNTPEFVAAVNKAAKPSKIGAVEFMGDIQLVTRRDGTVTVGAGETVTLNMENWDLVDTFVVNKYGENWEGRVKAKTIADIEVPNGLLLAGLGTDTMYLKVYNATDTAYVFNSQNQGVVMNVDCFC